MKRLFDILLAAIGLILAAPVMFLAALAVRFDTPGPILFRQKRIGKDFRTFELLKFRSMRVANAGSQVTFGEDLRITSSGRWLRKVKFDELPQLWNVLRGDMSFVGPRPEVPQYVELYRDRYEKLLGVRPGITDRASIKYRSESAILGSVDDPENYYRTVILPDKIAMGEEYVERHSVVGDIGIILQTVLVVFKHDECVDVQAPAVIAKSTGDHSR
ncbi:sugar transferase [Candidatus Koribacter versatilis Ellin345]|uniref:Sugar transferase n=1 Tax=Koribacter versatilis (strain Ellin345) TaxID=204669 RepID=Q1ILF0_KORVE|nr:sugar transferase [Candidatus Koribacter versatilis]ABF42300.1 sugar transferase [Candidatus Koribacter versatilis Ellin345]